MPNWDPSQCTFSLLMSSSSITALLKQLEGEENEEERTEA